MHVETWIKQNHLGMVMYQALERSAFSVFSETKPYGIYIFSWML